MIGQARSGDWLTADRIRAVALVSLALGGLSLLYLLATAHGTLDAWGRPLGTDFSNVWTAGRWRWTGAPRRRGTGRRITRCSRRRMAMPDVPFYGWHYPPPFLLLAALLGGPALSRRPVPLAGGVALGGGEDVARDPAGPEGAARGAGGAGGAGLPDARP